MGVVSTSRFIGTLSSTTATHALLSTETTLGSPDMPLMLRTGGSWWGSEDAERHLLLKAASHNPGDVASILRVLFHTAVV